MKHPIIFVAIFASLLACQSEVQRQLDLADSLLEEHPDSSLAIVSQINTDHLKRDRDKAYYALVKSAALDKNYIDTPDDSLINIAVAYYSRHGDSYARMRAWYYQGIVRINAKHYTTAVVSLEKAEREAEYLKNLRFIGLINRNIGTIFNANNNFESAINYSEKALSAFEDNHDDIYAEYMKYSLAICHLNNRDFSQARLLLRDIIDHSPYSQLVSQARLNYARALLSTKDSLSVALEIYRTEPKSLFYYMDYGYYAYALSALGQRDSAARWMHYGRKSTHTRVSRLTLESLLAQIDVMNGHYYEAYQKISDVMSAQDSLTKVLLQQSLANAQRDYYQQEMALQDSNIQKRRIIGGTGGVIMLLLFVIITLFYREQRKRKDAIIKEQMANLAIMQKNAQVDKRSLVGFWFLEKLARLCGLSDKYYTSENLPEKEEALRQFKKGVHELKHSEQWFSELEANLNKYCFGIMEKLEAQVPQIKGENKTIIALFFADIPDAIIQLLMGRLSPGSIRTLRSRLRKEIKDYNPPDKDLFLDMLAKKTA